MTSPALVMLSFPIQQKLHSSLVKALRLAELSYVPSGNNTAIRANKAIVPLTIRISALKKMVRAYAARLIAAVADLHGRIKRPVCKLVGKPMGKFVNALMGYSSVSAQTVTLSGPKPTGFGFRNSLPKFLCKWRGPSSHAEHHTVSNLIAKLKDCGGICRL